MRLRYSFLLGLFIRLTIAKIHQNLSVLGSLNFLILQYSQYTV
jgi:hypothetical protein